MELRQGPGAEWNSRELTERGAAGNAGSTMKQGTAAREAARLRGSRRLDRRGRAARRRRDRRRVPIEEHLRCLPFRFNGDVNDRLAELHTPRARRGRSSRVRHEVGRAIPSGEEIRPRVSVRDLFLPVHPRVRSNAPTPREPAIRDGTESFDVWSARTQSDQRPNPGDLRAPSVAIAHCRAPATQIRSMRAYLTRGVAEHQSDEGCQLRLRGCLLRCLPGVDAPSGETPFGQHDLSSGLGRRRDE